jgi:hypothetical protein
MLNPPLRTVRVRKQPTWQIQAGYVAPDEQAVLHRPSTSSSRAWLKRR